MKVDNKGKKHEERLIFHVESKGTYMNRETIIRQPDLLESLKKQALREMITFKVKYKRIKDLEPVLSEMDKAIEKFSEKKDSDSSDRPNA